jgi:hypothetical protein
MSEHDARFLFFWSQSVVRDELRNRQRAVSLIFPDFVEVRLEMYSDPECADDDTLSASSLSATDPRNVN